MYTLLFIFEYFSYSPPCAQPLHILKHSGQRCLGCTSLIMQPSYKCRAADKVVLSLLEVRATPCSRCICSTKAHNTRKKPRVELIFFLIFVFFAFFRYALGTCWVSIIQIFYNVVIKLSATDWTSHLFHRNTSLLNAINPNNSAMILYNNFTLFATTNFKCFI